MLAYNTVAETMLEGAAAAPAHRHLTDRWVARVKAV